MFYNALKLTQGEKLVIEAVRSWGWMAEPSQVQPAPDVSGKRVWIKNPTWARAYSVQVLENMDQYGSFWIDPAECMKPKKRNDRFWHVNVDTGWMAWYGREDIQYHITINKITKPFQVRVFDDLPFTITRRKCEYGI